jgi:hypothetical protein
LDIAQDISLGLLTLVKGETALGSRFPSFARQANILMIANSLFRETAEDVMTIGNAVNPVRHVLHHLALNLRIAVVEIGVEQALQDVFCDLVDVDSCVIPGFDHSIDSIFDNNLCQVACWFIQNKIEMVFTQE